MFGWQALTFKRYEDLGDVYYGSYKQKICILSTTTLILINGLFFLLFYAYARGCHCDRLGIQIAQLAIIGTQLSMVLLSVVLLIGIHKVSEVPPFITSN